VCLKEVAYRATCIVFAIDRRGGRAVNAIRPKKRDRRNRQTAEHFVYHANIKSPGIFPNSLYKQCTFYGSSSEGVIMSLVPSLYINLRYDKLLSQ
jgi:hypothetical protein